MQVVVLGSASYIPFMRLTTPNRRSLVEDLLDIGVFSNMNASTKDDLSGIKNEYDRTMQAKNLMGEQRRMVGVFEEQFEEQRAAEIAKLDGKITTEEQQLADHKREYNELKEALASYDEVKQELAGLQTKVRDFERKKDKIDNLLETYAKERKFLDEHDNCPTCEQPISEDLKEQRYAVLDQKETQATTVMTQCDAVLLKHKNAMAAALKELQEANAIERDMRAIESRIPVHLGYLRSMKAEKERIQNAKQQKPSTVNVEELDEKIAQLEAMQSQLSEQRVVVEAATMLLKDNGIKARVVKHYLPIINRTINHYLNAMDFPILFTLDEEFNETIKSRHRDDFSYESFSEGEKKRIDLALLLTWRHVARLKNSAATNILILDEVFDSSLDAAGTEEFLKIIADLEKDTSVFVISHKTDQLVDKFANTIAFEKTKGFSTVV
jgi:DNA repair exonuclease SbcCD ATPase subunit